MDCSEGATVHGGAVVAKYVYFRCATCGKVMEYMEDKHTKGKQSLSSYCGLQGRLRKDKNTRVRMKRVSKSVYAKWVSGGSNTQRGDEN
jgi:hypothetical protein